MMGRNSHRTCSPEGSRGAMAFRYTTVSGPYSRPFHNHIPGHTVATSPATLQPNHPHPHLRDPRCPHQPLPPYRASRHAPAISLATSPPGYPPLPLLSNSPHPTAPGTHVSWSRPSHRLAITGGPRRGCSRAPWSVFQGNGTRPEGGRSRKRCTCPPARRR